jgi:HK97 family phage major capsid protein
MNRTKSLFSTAAIGALAAMSPAERAAGRFLRDGTGHTPATKTAVELAEEIKGEHKKAWDTVKEIAEKALAEAAKQGDMAKDTKEKADEALLKMNGFGEQLAELEQKLARQAPGAPERKKSLGEQFAESEAFLTLKNSSGQRGKASFEVKANLTSLTTDAAGSVGDALQPTRLPGIDTSPRRLLRMRDLISPGQMDGTSIEYVQQTGYTRSAAMVAEGAAKPQSDIKLELRTANARVIAHYMKASRQIIDDVPALRSIVDDELLYGLQLIEDAQILSGDGTGQNLYGIIPQATAYAAPISLADLTMIDVLRLAMLQAALALRPATGHVLHPTDWATIETSKDSIGRYVIGNPQGTLTPTLWNLPVVETDAMTVRKFLTGAFRGGAQLFDRWQARVEIATENEDDFIKNMLTILAEERLALAVKRPEAFIYGDFDTALAA